MAKGTPATGAVAKAGIAHRLHEYAYDPAADRIGLQAAEALGIAPARLLKTLMVRCGNEVVVALLASDAMLDLKRLAARAGAKSAEMLDIPSAERLTGYHVGGISPFGQKKRCRTFIDAGAFAHATVLVNGGRRGLQIELDPVAIEAALGAERAEIANNSA